MQCVEACMESQRPEERPYGDVIKDEEEKVMGVLEDEEEDKYCEVCDFRMRPGQWSDHRLGKKHLKKARRAAEAQDAAVPKRPPPALVTFLLAQPAERPPPGHINLRARNALTCEVLGYITTPVDASWGEIAARTGLRMPGYKVAPPRNAHTIRAKDFESVSVVKLAADDDISLG